MEFMKKLMMLIIFAISANAQAKVEKLILCSYTNPEGTAQFSAEIYEDKGNLFVSNIRPVLQVMNDAFKKGTEVIYSIDQPIIFTDIKSATNKIEFNFSKNLTQLKVSGFWHAEEISDMSRSEVTMDFSETTTFSCVTTP